MRIADDESHGHGLSKGTAQTQHAGADNTDAGVGDDDIAHDLPSRAADAIGGFLENGGYGVEYLAGDRGDERKYHDRKNQPRGQHTDAVGRSCKELVQDRDPAESIDKEWLHRCLKPGSEHEQSPDAINDAGNSCEKLYGSADRPSQADRAYFGQKHRNTETDGNPHQ